MLLLTGYQVEGSNGRLLMEKGVINVNGTMEKIQMGVEYFDFSAHAGHKELINFVRACDPEQIILFHGDQRELLKQELEEIYNYSPEGEEKEDLQTSLDKYLQFKE